jgi:PAS domain-containing protein
MHAIFAFVFGLFVDVVNGTSALASVLTGLSHGRSDAGHQTFAAIVISGVIAGLIGCGWALLERMRAGRIQLRMNAELARAQSEIRFRESVISACPEAVVILGTDRPQPTSYRGGSALLQACLTGPDASALAARLDTLMAEGTAFHTTVRTAIHSAVTIEGAVVGSKAAVFLRIEETKADPGTDLATLLDILPMPVWIRDRNLALTWANRAFLTVAGAPTAGEAVKSNAVLLRSERDLARAASESGDIIDTRRYAVVDGRRRAFSIDVLRLPDHHVAGVAVDVTERTQADAQIKLNADAYADITDNMDTAVAVFDANRKLVFHNARFAEMWRLGEDWLDAHAGLDEILDRLRETRRLPEQRDFAAWKQDHLELFNAADGRLDDTWHLPGGTSIAVKARPYALGGMYYLFTDVSEPIRLRASFAMLAQIQRATLDAVEDGMAIFGPDGRLKMHNTAFAALWQLPEPDLSGEPHLARLSDLCAERTGRDGVWNLIAAGVHSTDPARFSEWSKVKRADGRMLSLALTRLPLGATLVTFVDQTDMSRFREALKPDDASAAA